MSRLALMALGIEALVTRLPELYIRRKACFHPARFQIGITQGPRLRSV